MAKKTEEKLPIVNKFVYKNIAKITCTQNKELEIIHFFLENGATLIGSHTNRANLIVLYFQQPDKKKD